MQHPWKIPWQQGLEEGGGSLGLHLRLPRTLRWRTQRLGPTASETKQQVVRVEVKLWRTYGVVWRCVKQFFGIRMTSGHLCEGGGWRQLILCSCGAKFAVAFSVTKSLTLGQHFRCSDQLSKPDSWAAFDEHQKICRVNVDDTFLVANTIASPTM